MTTAGKDTNERMGLNPHASHEGIPYPENYGGAFFEELRDTIAEFVKLDGWDDMLAESATDSGIAGAWLGMLAFQRPKEPDRFVDCTTQEQLHFGVSRDLISQEMSDWLEVLMSQPIILAYRSP